MVKRRLTSCSLCYLLDWLLSFPLVGWLGQPRISRISCISNPVKAETTSTGADIYAYQVPDFAGTDETLARVYGGDTPHRNNA